MVDHDEYRECLAECPAELRYLGAAVEEIHLGIVRVVSENQTALNEWYTRKEGINKISDTPMGIKVNDIGQPLLGLATTRDELLHNSVWKTMLSFSRVATLNQSLEDAQAAGNLETAEYSHPDDYGNDEDDEGDEAKSELDFTSACALISEYAKEYTAAIKLCRENIKTSEVYLNSLQVKWIKEVYPFLVWRVQDTKKPPESDDKSYTSAFTRALLTIHSDDPDDKIKLAGYTSLPSTRSTINAYIVLQHTGGVDRGESTGF